MRTIAAGLMPFMLVAAAPATTSYTIDSANSNVTAKVSIMRVSSKTARFPKVSGSVRLTHQRPERLALDVKIDATALTAPDRSTRNRLRGKHYFWVERHPTVRFTSRRLTLTGKRSGTVAGKLTARGVTKPVNLAVTFDKKPGAIKPGQTLTIKGQTTIDRRDFGMMSHTMFVGRKVTIKLNVRMIPA